MDEFTLWMNGLDAAEIAAKESFHSASHREMVKEHGTRLVDAKADIKAWREEMTEIRRASFARNLIRYEMNKIKEKS